MARRVFFSFHYQNDIWRVNQVRNSGEFRDVTGTDTFYDNSLWEETKRKGNAALRSLIEEGLKNSSVTVVLAAAETWSRPWIRYELIKSLERGNGLMTLWIDAQQDQFRRTATRGFDPLDCLHFAISGDGRTAATKYFDGSAWQSYETISTTSMSPAAKKLGSGKLSALASRHAWSSADAAAFARWCNEAAKAAGR